MKSRVVLGCLLAFAAAAAPKKAKKEPPPPPPVLTEPSAKLAEAMGGKVAEQLTQAARFEVARTSYTQGIRPKADTAIGSDFQRESEWKELSKAEVEALRAVIYDEKAFRLEASVSGCNFVPDLAFQMTNAGLDTLQMLVSFKCNQVLFFTLKSGGRTVPGVALDFKPARKKTLELVKAMLPRDSTVQLLK
jgi:hypothetical protein